MATIDLTNEITEQFPPGTVLDPSSGRRVGDFRQGLSDDAEMPDNWMGTSANELRYAARGNDTLRGMGGFDVLYGANGNDSIDGGAGTDCLVGEGGNDTLLGGADNDTIEGGGGSDSMDGGAGFDIVSFGRGIVGQCATNAEAVQRLSKVVAERAGPDAEPDLVRMITEVATADKAGMSDEEMNAVETVRRVLGTE